MPSDALTYSLCAKELNSVLKYGRINKISMPLPDMIHLNIRAGGQNHLLALSANASTPRLHLTKTPLPSPQVAPAFLMHLRKHLGNGTIEDISATAFERIVTITIKAYNELLIPESKSLIIEIMGKHSNIILVGENGVISDSIKHVTLDISCKRQVMSGLRYSPPPIQTDKIDISKKDELSQKLSQFLGGNLEKYLASILSGFSLATIREVIYRSKISSKTSVTLDKVEIDKIIAELTGIYDFSRSKPCTLKVGSVLKDFYIIPYFSAVEILREQEIASNISISEQNFIFYDSLNEAMDEYFTSNAKEQINSSRRNLLQTIIRTALSKCQKKLGTLLQKQQDAIDFEEDKKKGDLILSNLYRIRKGDSEIEVEDYYNNNNQLRIKIDPYKSPQANAQMFYKSYNKKKIALQKLETFISELNDNIEYLESLNYFSETIIEEQEFNEILSELIRLGYHKKKLLPKKTVEQKQNSYRATSFEGYNILVGKSSLGNDQLVKQSKPNSVWLHASGIHGSHVIIENDAPSMPPTNVLAFAASLAAFYSKAKFSENVPVDYTFIKNVKKPKGSIPGKVIFTSQRTLFVTPQQAENLN